MVTDTQPLIDAIVENIDDSDGRRAQRFLDDLRQEGVLPGRRSRLAYALRRVRRTLAGWVEYHGETVRILFARRQPASHWVERMEQLLAEGQTAEDAARTVEREMRWEDSDQGMRRFMWAGVGFVAAVWTVLGLALANVL